MIVVGLTGSIGMGKSNAAQVLRRLGVPVHDADAAVHKLLGPGGRAVRKVAELFPKALNGNRIDRKVLGDQVFGDTPALRRLESVLHPLVRQSSRAFVAAAARRRLPVVVLDIPLLYESRGERSVDLVIVVSAPRTIQRQRVLARPGMTEDKFHAILARQVPVLFCSGYSDTSIMPERFAGVPQMSKPYAESSLRDAMVRVFARQPVAAHAQG